VARVADENEFHPVREYLASLKWDGVKRLDNWLIYYLGVEPDPKERPKDEVRAKEWDSQLNYIRAVGSRFMISAVARVFQPGTKADCVLILEGPQGIFKSTVFKTIGDPLGKGWFTDELAEIGSKDAAMQLSGKWIIELAELDSMTRSDVGRTKAFISRASDYYRPAYGRQTVDVPRQCVFGGSVNDDEYLQDPTGGRRFWPVKPGKIDIEALTTDRDQLWAEALTRYNAGDRWWLHEDEIIKEANDQQAERYKDDAWEGVIQTWLEKHPQLTEFSKADVFVEMLDISDKSKWTRADETRIGRCIRSIGGWQRKRKRMNGRPVWVYSKILY